jgi:hypothetical protein
VPYCQGIIGVIINLGVDMKSPAYLCSRKFDTQEILILEKM